jgi:uncharacterized pyridoxamine 5'-phosphate oxidase family protein
MKISEAVKILKKKDWVLIHSDKLNDKFILKRHQRVVVNNPEFPEYTLDEIKVLREIPETDRKHFLKVMYNIKKVFDGAYMVFEKGGQDGL